MSILKKLFSKLNKDEQNSSFRRKMAKEIDGRHLRYITERFDSDEVVVGKDGHVNITDKDYLSVVCGIKTIFRAKIEELSIAHLMSLEGSVLEGFDIESGKDRKIIIYYKYHR